MKIQKNSIYNTFRNNSLGKNETLNDILKGTKSILASKNGFKEYITNYTNFTKKPTFKNPDITDYPILKTESAFLIPVSMRKNNNSEFAIHKIRIRPIKKIFFSNDIIDNNKHLDFREKYNKRFYRFLRLKTETDNMRLINRKIYETRFKRYNTLFLDFFNKWNGYDNNKISLINQKTNNNDTDYNFDSITYNYETQKDNSKINMFNIKESYHGLYYNEKEIFNSNYDSFILNKIKQIKENKITNYINYVESSFNDINDKEIKLKLESIKLSFYPQTKAIKELNKNNNSENNKFSIYLPLSYVFLFYYNDFEFFQKVLASILFFNDDFKKINFNDDELYNLLDTINTEEKEENKEKDFLAKFQKAKKNSKYKIFDKKDLRKTFNKSNNIFMNKFFVNKSSNKNKGKIGDKKIKIIHSNCFLREKINYSNTEENKNNSELKRENTKSKNEFFYNEYHFIWETPKITYKVKMEMPKIFFFYENLKYEIVSFCEKNLFLYLYKHNFINWDFFVLNYFYSIKTFRTFILRFFSLNKNISIGILPKMKENHIKNLKTISTNGNIEYINSLLEEKNNEPERNINKLFLSNKKIFNQMNENNESYIFFYSDFNSKNYIYHFYSYHIKIEYQKLNPKLKWEFFLNFKQMKQLNEISKYEQLSSFLPKIIKTNFEFGLLDINFEILDENFNPKILLKEENNMCVLNKQGEINIEIKNPFIEKEIISERNIKKEKTNLNYTFLRNINKIKMSEWSKRILRILKADLNPEKEELNIVDNLKNKYFKIDENIREIRRFKSGFNKTFKHKLSLIPNKNNKLILNDLEIKKYYEN